MAFENIQSTEEITSPEQTSNALDLTGIDSPFDSFNGLNLQAIEEKSKILEVNDPNTSTDLDKTPPVVSPEDDKKPKTKQQLINEANEIYENNKVRSKVYAQNLGKIASQYVNPAFAYGDYAFDRYKTNVDRYLGYGESTFRELGFNPLEDNETYYNKNVSAYRDWIRMSGHLGTLLGSSFTSNYRSIGNMISGGSALTLDMKGEAEFSKANRLGSSSRGGFTGFGVNLALNSAYSLGITANIVAEEIGIYLLGAALAPETGGASLAVAGAVQAAEATSVASRLNRIRKVMSGAYNATTLGSVTKGSYQMLKSLYRADEAKNFWQGAKVFAGGFNPLRQTTALAQDIYKGTEGYKNLSNLAKMSRGFGAFYRDSREAMFTISEAQLEGAGVTQELINDRIDKFTTDKGYLPTGQVLEDIYKNAYTAGKVDALGNIPLIYLTNRITFDGLFKFRGVKSLIEAAERSVPSFGKQFIFNAGEKTFVESAKQGLYKTTIKAITNPRKYLGSFLSYTKHNFSEGIQELGQEWLADATKKRYERLYKDPFISQSDLLKTSVWSGLGSTVFSKDAGSAAKDQIFSGQGLNTFFSGFLMGGLIGGGKFSMTKLANGVWNKSAELYMKKASPEKFEQYIKAKQELKDKHLQILNTLFSNPEDFFSRKKESLVIQRNANNNLTQSDSNDDNKTFYDNKDEKTLDHVFSSLDAGTYDALLDGFQELKKLSDNELADYFNVEDGGKAREKLDEYLGRAKEIKNRYDYVNEKFKNPFNPKKYERGTPEQINEFIAYKAFQDAKKDAIASQYGFNRAIERMEGIYQDLSKDKPIRSSTESDYNVLFNPNTIKAEIALLNEEADLLEKGEKPGDKTLAKRKREKAEALKEYLQNYLAFKKKKGKEVYDDKGQMEIIFNEDLLEPLRKSYHKYLKAVANLNDDYIFDDKIDNSFSKILDYYNLDEDARKYTDAINHLSNPENLVRHADRINTTLNDLYQNRFQLQKEGLDKYFSFIEMQHLISSIGRLGIIVDPQELIDLAKNGTAPETFFDLKNNKIIDKNDSRYAPLIEMIETYKSLRNQDEQDQEEEQPEQVTKTEEETKTAETKVEETKKEEPKVVSTEVEQALRDAYNNFIAETGSDVEYEEFVRDHPVAHAIKKKATTTPSTTQPEQKTVAEPEEKVIEVKLPEIEVVKEGELAIGDRVKINTEKDGESVIKEDRGDKVLLEDGRQVAKKNITKLEKAPEVKAEEKKVETPTAPVSEFKTVDDIKKYFFNKNPGLFGGDLNAALTMSNWEIVTNSLQKGATQEELNMLDVINGRINISDLQGKPVETTDVEARKNKSLASIKFGNPVKGTDIETKTAILYKADGTTEEISDTLDPTRSPSDWRLRQTIEDFYKKESTGEEAKPSSKEKIGNILSGIKSLSEFPSTNLNDTSETTNKLLKLISDGGATAAEVITEVKAKYEEMIKNLKPSDFKKGDIVTFTDGTKGIVNSVSDKSVNIKRFNTPKGEVDIIEAKDLSKRVKMVKGSKEAIQEEKETPAVEVGKEDKQAIQQSQNTADGLISDATKAKNIISDGIKNAEKGEDLGFDDLLLGCD